uniref:DC_STAMP domain-containing protein n=1 Tax=Heterorhabditis bacteriophora TaxID=37862 RepID=A0A1I7XKX6_HETBA
MHFYPRENALARLFRNIILLELFGIIMYTVMAMKYAKNPGQAGTFMSIVVHFFLSVMFVFPAVMKYFMIAVHRMMSTNVRALLLLIIMSLAFEVPAMNAVNNIHKVAEGVACIQDDVLDSVNAINGFAADKGRASVDLVSGMIAKLAAPMNWFKNTLRKLDHNVTRLAEMIKGTWKSLSNLTNKCKSFMMTPYATVCAIGKKAADEAICNFPSVTKWALKDGAFFIFKESWRKVFQAVELALFFHIKGFEYFGGKASGTMRKGFSHLKDLRTIHIHMKTSGGEPNTDEMKQIKKNLSASLSSIIAAYQQTIQLIITIIHWTFIPLTLFWPFLSTALFVYRFNYREEFENFYLTEEFDKIDLDMALRGRSKVLPLSKAEQAVYTLRKAWRMTSSEKNRYRMALVMTILMVATPFTFVLMDYSIYKVLTNVFLFMNMTQVEFPAHYEMKSRKNILGEIMERQRVKKISVEMSIEKYIYCVGDFQAQLATDQMAGRETIVRRGMQSRGFIRVQCCKCEASDLRLADQANTRLCVNCGSFYCINCFCLGRYCKECGHDMQVIDKMELYYEDETDDEEVIDYDNEEEEEDDDDDDDDGEIGNNKEDTTNVETATLEKSAEIITI